MVGAGPGGTGKTTVMCALLNFVPNGVPLAPAADGAAVREALATGAAPPRRCYVCHEIGPGRYYAYLWGRAAADFFDLPRAGHMIATNLHADTLAEAEEQLLGDVGVSPEGFLGMSLALFMTAERGGGYARRVTAVHESDGRRHRLLFAWDPARRRFARAAASALVTPGDEQAAGRVLERVAGTGARTVRRVREEVTACRA
jgi:hypothetical protein